MLHIFSSKKMNAKNIEISNQDSSDGLANSVDALTGKFQSSIDSALASGKAPSLKKWTALKKAIDNAIEQAKRGETPKITKSLAKQHAGVFGRLKKELGK
jgi:thiamine monophosphate kinase